MFSKGFEAFQTVLEFAEQREKFKPFRIPMVVLPATISNNVPGKTVIVAVVVSVLEYGTGCIKKLFPLRFLSISQLPLSLEIPSWAIFNSPFCVDFENVQFVFFWLNLDRDIGKILQ